MTWLTRIAVLMLIAAPIVVWWSALSGGICLVVGLILLAVALD